MMEKIKNIIKLIFYIFSLDVRNPPPTVLQGITYCTFSSTLLFLIVISSLEKLLKQNHLCGLLFYTPEYSVHLFCFTLLFFFVFFCICFFGGKRGKRIIEEYEKKNIRYQNTMHLLFPLFWVVFLICLHIVITHFLNQ